MSIEKSSESTKHCGLYCCLPPRKHVDYFDAKVVEKESPIPLTGVSVHTQLIDYHALVTIKQEYENKENVPIEPFYIFPLDERSVITKFRATIAGKIFDAKIKKTADAVRDYTEATTAGKFAGLMEQKTNDVFSMKLGNVKSGQKVTAEITYATELRVVDGKFVYSLPTFVAPRYKSEDMIKKFEMPLSTKGVTEDIIYSKNIPYKLKFTATCQMGSTVKSITSTTHKIHTRIAPDNIGNAEIELLYDDCALDKDVVLQIETADMGSSKLFVHTDKTTKDTILMLCMTPQFEGIVPKQLCEFIFVVDCSGSMANGGKKECAKESLDLFLSSLPTDCYFNIVYFGSDYKFLWDQSKKYSEGSLKEARKYADTVNANMNGTELLEPIEKVLSLKSPNNEQKYVRQVFLLTDGGVSETKELITFVKSKLGTSRIFTMGIGEDVSRELVGNLALACNGTYRYALDSKDMSRLVVSQLNESQHPSYKNVKVDWSAIRTMQTPHRLGNVTQESSLIVYGILKNTNEEQVREELKDVTLTAIHTDGTLLKHTVALSDRSFVKSDFCPLGALAARSKIRELENKESYEFVDSEYSKEDANDEIVRWSGRYNILSHLTSFVLVDESDPENKKDQHVSMVQRKVPVNDPFSSNISTLSAQSFAFSPIIPKMKMSGPISQCMPLQMSRAPQQMLQMQQMPQKMALGQMKSKNAPVKELFMFDSHSVDGSNGNSDDKEMGEVEFEDDADIPTLSTNSSKPSLKSLSFDDSMKDVTKQSNFDGSFNKSVLKFLLNVPEKKIEEMLTQFKCDTTLLVTLVVLAYIKNGVGTDFDLQNKYKSIVEKAKQWVDKYTNTTVKKTSVDDLRTEVLKAFFMTA